MYPTQMNTKQVVRNKLKFHGDQAEFNRFELTWLETHVGVADYFFAYRSLALFCVSKWPEIATGKHIWIEKLAFLQRENQLVVRRNHKMCRMYLSQAFKCSSKVWLLRPAHFEAVYELHESLEALENRHGNLLAKNDSYVSCHSITLHLFSLWPSSIV